MTDPTLPVAQLPSLQWWLDQVITSIQAEMHRLAVQMEKIEEHTSKQIEDLQADIRKVSNDLAAWKAQCPEVVVSATMKEDKNPWKAKIDLYTKWTLRGLLFVVLAQALKILNFDIDLERFNQAYDVYSKVSGG